MWTQISFFFFFPNQISRGSRAHWFGRSDSGRLSGELDQHPRAGVCVCKGVGVCVHSCRTGECVCLCSGDSLSLALWP